MDVSKSPLIGTGGTAALPARVPRRALERSPFGRGEPARSAVERVVQGELLQRPGAPAQWLHLLRRAQPADGGGSSAGESGVQVDAARMRRAAAFYQAHARLPTVADAAHPTRIDYYA